MQFEKGYLYHIFNQGNNRQKVFFNRENYLYFLKKIKTHISPFCDIIAWCLMPNHFHLMVLVKETHLSGGTTSILSGGTTSSRAPANTPTDKTVTLNKSIGILLASYTRAINKQNNLTGSLFRKRTKAECINCPNGITPSFVFHRMTSSHRMNVAIPEKQYPQICFNYIHQNPVKANLVKKDIDWMFSSAPDYFGGRKGKLVNKKIAEEYIEIWQ